MENFVFQVNIRYDWRIWFPLVNTLIPMPGKSCFSEQKVGMFSHSQFQSASDRRNCGEHLNPQYATSDSTLQTTNTPPLPPSTITAMAVFRKRASVSLTHSLSMFQPSLSSNHNNSNSSLNQYKPPLFTSSCNSISEETKNTEEKSGKSRSQRQANRR